MIGNDYNNWKVNAYIIYISEFFLQLPSAFLNIYLFLSKGIQEIICVPTFRSQIMKPKNKTVPGYVPVI